jgi:hypothetical protein
VKHCHSCGERTGGWFTIGWVNSTAPLVGELRILVAERTCKVVDLYGKWVCPLCGGASHDFVEETKISTRRPRAGLSYGYQDWQGLAIPPEAAADGQLHEADRCTVVCRYCVEHHRRGQMHGGGSISAEGHLPGRNHIKRFEPCNQYGLVWVGRLHGGRGFEGCNCIAHPQPRRRRETEQEPDDWISTIAEAGISTLELEDPKPADEVDDPEPEEGKDAPEEGEDEPQPQVIEAPLGEPAPFVPCQHWPGRDHLCVCDVKRATLEVEADRASMRRISTLDDGGEWRDDRGCAGRLSIVEGPFDEPGGSVFHNFDDTDLKVEDRIKQLTNRELWARFVAWIEGRSRMGREELRQLKLRIFPPGIGWELKRTKDGRFKRLRYRLPPSAATFWERKDNRARKTTAQRHRKGGDALELARALGSGNEGPGTWSRGRFRNVDPVELVRQGYEGHPFGCEILPSFQLGGSMVGDGLMRRPVEGLELINHAPAYQSRKKGKDGALWEPARGWTYDVLVHEWRLIAPGCLGARIGHGIGGVDEAWSHEFEVRRPHPRRDDWPGLKEPEPKGPGSIESRRSLGEREAARIELALLDESKARLQTLNEQREAAGYPRLDRWGQEPPSGPEITYRPGPWQWGYSIGPSIREAERLARLHEGHEWERPALVHEHEHDGRECARIFPAVDRKCDVGSWRDCTRGSGFGYHLTGATFVVLARPAQRRRARSGG